MPAAPVRPGQAVGHRLPPDPSERETTEIEPSGVASYFNDQGPLPASPEDIIDTDAATRVAVDAQIFGNPKGPPSVRPSLMDSGWRREPSGDPSSTSPVAAAFGRLPMDGGEERTMVLPAPEELSRNYRPAAGVPASDGSYFPDASDMPTSAGGGLIEPVYVVEAQVVDPRTNMPVAPEYGLVPASAVAQQGGPEAAGYSWLRINPPDHVAPVSTDLAMMTRPEGYVASQFRALRYRLEQEPNTQIIVVTSAREGDGKSVTAANLALALAEGGRIQVLLVDGALRAPAQHRLFGIRGELGLTSVLAARQDDPSLPVDVIGITRSLCLIPAGPPVASPHAALASEAAAVLIGIIRREFRYIIVDSSPLFGSAETLAWHGLIDKYILVARASKTTTEDLSAAAERLNRDRILGVTFVGARVRRK